MIFITKISLYYTELNSNFHDVQLLYNSFKMRPICWAVGL